MDRSLAYLNVDISVAGHDSISISATPLLYTLAYQATKMVTHIVVAIYILCMVF